jgi:hypothetical protein
VISSVGLADPSWLAEMQQITARLNNAGTERQQLDSVDANWGNAVLGDISKGLELTQKVGVLATSAQADQQAIGNALVEFQDAFSQIVTKVSDRYQDAYKAPVWSDYKRDGAMGYAAYVFMRISTFMKFLSQDMLRMNPFGSDQSGKFQVREPEVNPIPFLNSPTERRSKFLKSLGQILAKNYYLAEKEYVDQSIGGKLPVEAPMAFEQMVATLERTSNSEVMRDGAAHTRLIRVYSYVLLPFLILNPPDIIGTFAGHTQMSPFFSSLIWTAGTLQLIHLRKVGAGTAFYKKMTQLLRRADNIQTSAATQQPRTMFTGVCEILGINRFLSSSSR